MKYLYHGSNIDGITGLKPYSKLHNTDKKVVYLTDNIPYALLYIWDENVIGFSCKHITGWVKNGVVYYEEQFPDQLKTFYKGAAGYLYHIKMNSDFSPVEERECMFFSSNDTIVEKAEYIQDVYEKLMKYETLGNLKVLRYNEQTPKRQKELNDMMVTAIIRSNFYVNHESRVKFTKKYFAEAWERAMQKQHT